MLVRHNPGVACTIESISFGGARLAGPLTLVIGERVSVLFEVDGSPIEVAATVVRVDRQDITIDRIAIAFDEISDETRALLRRLVDESLDLAQL